MPRQLRIEYPGAIYHVMNRGDRREPIYQDDADRTRFLQTLGDACRKTDWQIHAYCLMGNHFHVVLETPGANLVDGMRWFLSTYTARFTCTWAPVCTWPIGSPITPLNLTTNLT
jgi:putative transposase